MKKGLVKYQYLLEIASIEARKDLLKLIFKFF